MVPRRGNLWEQVDVDNFGVLSSKIVGIQAMGMAVSLVFVILCLVLVKSEWCMTEAKNEENFNKKGMNYNILYS